MGFKVYDSKEVTIVFAGIPIDGGYGEDEFCSIEQNEEDFVIVVGTDGEVTRSKTNNQSAKVMITLMQSATVNAALSALNNLDKAAGNGAGVGPILIKDRQGTSLYTGAKAWIAKPPDAKFAKKAGPRVWELHVAALKRLDGGN